jgi:hypothetical protein
LRKIFNTFANIKQRLHGRLNAIGDVGTTSFDNRNKRLFYGKKFDVQKIPMFCLMLTNFSAL